MEGKPTTVLVARQVAYTRGIMDIVWFKRDVDGNLVMHYYEVKSSEHKTLIQSARYQADKFYEEFPNIPTAQVIRATPSYDGGLACFKNLKIGE